MKKIHFLSQWEVLGVISKNIFRSYIVPSCPGEARTKWLGQIRMTRPDPNDSARPKWLGQAEMARPDRTSSASFGQEMWPSCASAVAELIMN